MAHEIDSQTIATVAGDYTVRFVYDDYADQPYDEGFSMVAMNRSRYIDLVVGEVPYIAESVIRMSGSEDYWPYQYRSGAALVRYLTLKGYKGVTLIDQGYGPINPTAHRFDTLYGIAIAPGDVPADRADEYVRNTLAQWQAWADGDVFGYVVEASDGTEVDSCWGYYDYWRERDYVLSEATASAEGDAADRIRSANLVGAGFVGIV